MKHSLTVSHLLLHVKSGAGSKDKFGLNFSGLLLDLLGKASVFLCPFWSRCVGFQLMFLKDPIAFGFRISDSLIVIQTGSLLFCPT